MKVFWTLEPLERRNLLLVFASGLLFWCSLGSLLPAVPTYIKDIGGSDRQVGIVMAAFAIGLLLCRPQLGKIADNRSRRTVLLLGAMVAAIAPIGHLLARSIPLLFAIRVFHGLSIAAFTTGYSALVADLSPPRQRGELIGYMSLVSPIGLAIGPAIGGFLQQSAGYPPLFLFAAAAGMLSCLGIIQVKEGKKTQILPDTASGAVEEKFWQLLLSPRLLVPALVLCLVGFLFGAIHSFVPLFIREIKVNFNAGWFYTAAAIASFSSRLFIGRASDIYGRGLFITASLCCYTAAMLVLATANSANMLLLAGCLEGASSGTIIPMMVTLFADRSTASERGRVFSLGISGLDLGTAIAGPMFGFLASDRGYRAVFASCAGLSLLALLIFTTLSSKDLTHSWRFAWGRSKDVYALDKHY